MLAQTGAQHDDLTRPLVAGVTYAVEWNQAVWGWHVTAVTPELLEVRAQLVAEHHAAQAAAARRTA
jgi:hypothetical protein